MLLALQLPLVALAAAATIIAGQAIISGTFSMTPQAIQLGLCPRLHITQTSSEGYGQIAVALTMLPTSLLMLLAMREAWGWSLLVSVVVAGPFVIVDFSFVAATMMRCLRAAACRWR